MRETMCMDCGMTIAGGCSSPACRRNESKIETITVSKSALLNLIRAIDVGAELNPNQFNELRLSFTSDEIANGF